MLTTEEPERAAHHDGRRALRLAPFDARHELKERKDE
jgi:hypothetical protein